MNELPVKKEQTADHLIILFDGACNLCNESVQFIIERDQKKLFKFASLQSDLGKRLARNQGLDPERMHSLVLIEGARSYTKSDATIRIAVELSGIWPIIGLLHLVPRPIRNFGYNIIAKNRYKWFGKSNSCMVPTEENEGRFLS